MLLKCVLQFWSDKQVSKYVRACLSHFVCKWVRTHTPKFWCTSLTDGNHSKHCNGAWTAHNWSVWIIPIIQLRIARGSVRKIGPIQTIMISINVADTSDAKWVLPPADSWSELKTYSWIYLHMFKGCICVYTHIKRVGNSPNLVWEYFCV